MTVEEQLDWSLLPIDEVAEALDTGPDGLSEAAAAERLEAFGPNELEEEPPTTAFALLLHQFQDPLIYILLVATVATLLMGEYIDSAVIAFVSLSTPSSGSSRNDRPRTPSGPCPGS